MTLNNLVHGFFCGAAALVMCVGLGDEAIAADAPVAPPSLIGLPTPVPATASCPTCAAPAGHITSGCSSCSKSRMHFPKRCNTGVPQIAPGSCFGYFPTQWSRWEDVCPVQYSGLGLSNLPPPPPVPTTPTVPSAPMPKPDVNGKNGKKNGELPPPRPSPMPKGAGATPLPSIPTPMPSPLPPIPKP
jgi:hypothetical protein